MASKKREWYPGAIYHVMGRGIRKMAIYKDDYNIFLRILYETQKKMGFKVCIVHSGGFHIPA